MSETVRVRPMVAADVEAVMHLAAGLDTAPHWPRAAYDAALDSANAPPRIGLVAESGGVVTGFVIASMIPPQAELETIAVALSRQRRGAGSALLSALIRALEAREIAEMTLEVRATNARAIAFYGAHGFEAFARREGYFADSREAAIMMRAPIPRSAKRK